MVFCWLKRAWRISRLCGIIFVSFSGCGWFFSKKQISNFPNFLRKFLTQNLLPASKRIVFVILLAVLFLPMILSTKSVNAFSRSVFLDGTISDESVTGNCPTDKMPMWYGIQISKAENERGEIADIGTEDDIIVNTTIFPGTNYDSQLTEQQREWLRIIRDNCMRKVADGKIRLRLTINDGQTNGILQYRSDSKAIDVASLGHDDKTFGAGFGPFRLKLPSGLNAFNVRFNLEVSNAGDNARTYYYNFAKVLAGRTGNDDAITRIPSSQDGGGQDTLVDISKINLRVHGTTDGKGLKDLYRTWVGDTQPMVFGSNNLDAINVSCVEGSNCGSPGDKVTLPEKDDSWWPETNPTYKHYDGGFNFTKDVSPELVKCAPRGWFSSSQCPKSFFGTGDLASYGVVSEPIVGFALPLKPTVNPTVWASAKAGDVIELTFLPRLTVVEGINAEHHVIFNTSGAKTKLEVYATKDEVKQKCVAEHASDPTFCDNDNNIRYQVGKNLDVTASTTEQKANGSLVDSLFDFLRRVIAYIVLLITSFIYYIFSAILVPVIIALIKIHPYQDKFVNFIYPGWVIIRNISNIFFIVALLWVGLRTLLQLDDAAKSRSFIIQLILMALLVNFSLVIGQSIVGIADTVQSQFLPEGTKVVETLGHKLMVDPIITFRGGSDSLTDVSGRFDKDALASDLPKAIILLILAIAAFFAFVALIAFMVVRLAALWILYMLSPLAFVGRILPQTEKIADKWWTEFTKYAFAVPIMAFFLNITALMAVQMAKPTGTSVDTGGGSGTVIFGGLLNTGDLGAGAVSFAVTVISHFIVLVFLFIGMKFALSFGGVGAEKIVDAAKKGFNAVTTRPAKWAGGLAKDAAKEYGRNQYERRIAGGMLDPKAWKDQFKGRVAATTEKKKLERLSAKANRLSPGNILPTEGSLADRGKHIGKYMWAKIKRQDPHGLLKNVNDMRERASILTRPARQDLETKQADSEAKILAVEHEQELLDTNTITQDRALSYRDALDQRITSARQQSIDLDNKRRKLENRGLTGGAEHQAVVNEIAALNTDMGNLLNARAIVANPTGDMTLTDAQIASMSVIFDPKQLASELSGDLKKAEQQSQHTAKQLARDDELRRKYSVATITEPEQRALLRQAALLEQKAISTYMPASMTALAAGRSLESEQAKKIEHIEDVDELVQAYSGAMSKNNTALATAIAKKLAKVGGMDELLKSQGYNNNMKDFQRFMEENFKHLAPQIRVQVGSEISQVAKSNGNLTLGNSANYNYNKSTGETTVKWAQPEETARKVDAKLKGTQTAAFAKMQKTDISEERGGMSYLHQGAIDNLNSMNSNTLNSFLRQSSPSLRKHILDAANSNKVKSQVLTRLREGAR